MSKLLQACRYEGFNAKDRRMDETTVAYAYLETMEISPNTFSKPNATRSTKTEGMGICEYSERLLANICKLDTN